MPLVSRLEGRRRGYGIVATLAVVLAVGVVGEPVEAAGTAHAAWVVTGANPSWSGTATIPATDFPVASFTTNSNSPSTPTAAFLNAATPYGAVFGTTQTRNYLSAAAAAGQAPSTTTFTFASPTPSSGWGFAFGDIDADQLTIRASGPGGPLTSAQLGFSGTFNYCTVATPRPTSCGGVQTDVPTWNPTTATLVGNGVDTGGASGWFRPTVPITSMTLTYSVLTGIPSFQMWMSSLTFDITGTVRLDTGAAAPPGTSLQLVDADGNVVATTPALADGSYRFTPLAPAAYTVRVVPPSGYQVVGPAVRPADARASDVPGIDFALTLVLATTTTTTTSTSTTTTTTTLPPTTTSTTTLPATTSTTTLPPTTSSSTTTTLPATTTTTTTLPPTTTSSTTTTTLPPTTTSTSTTSTTLPPTTTSTTTTTLPPTTTSTTTLPPTTSSSTTTTLPPTTTSSTTTTTLPPTTSSTTTTTLPPTTTSSTTTTTLPPPPAAPTSTTTLPTSTTSTTVLPTSTTSTTVLPTSTTSTTTTTPTTSTTSTTSTTVVGQRSAGGLTRSPIATPTRRPDQLPATGATTTGNVLVLAAVVLGGGLALMVLARRDRRPPPAR